MSNSIAPGSSADINVKVTALTTNQNVPVTYKTVILKKNLVNGVNTLTQEMMSATNTKYIIKYDYVLGEDITVPTNCILEFDGGSISNGILIGKDTIIKASQISIFGNDITISGTWNNFVVYSEWINLDLSSNTDNYGKFINLINLVNNSSGTLKIQEGTIVTSYIKPKDNITIEGCGDSTIIKQYSNASLYLAPIEVSRADNVTIKNLSIDGNYPNLTVDNSRHSIYVVNSKNTLIENVNIYNSCDAIMLGYSENPTSQVIIRNSYFHDCYRNTLVFAHCEDVIVENCVCKGYKEYSALVDFEKHNNGDIHKNIVLNNCKFIKSTETSTNQPGYDTPQCIKLTTNGLTGECANIIFENCDIQHYVQLFNFDNVSFKNCKIYGIEGHGASNIIIDSCYNNNFLSSGNILFFYSDSGSKESNNICITNCKFIYPNSSNVNGIAIMGVENINIINTIIINLKEAFTINYDNSNITLCSCLIKGNAVGIKAVSDTYTKLSIIGCSIYDNKTTENDVEVDTNYVNLKSSETIKTIYENYKNNNCFGLKSLILYGKKSSSVANEIYEDSNGYLKYKDSNNEILHLGYMVLGGDSAPSGTPYNLNSRFLDTRKNIWYDAVETYNNQGQHTYINKFAPRCIINTIQPFSNPDFAGQFYINTSNDNVFIAKGISSVNDWLQIL